MKTVFASLLIALTTATSFAGIKPGDNTTPTTFQSSVYVTQNGDLKVAVDKEKGQAVSILLTTPDGQVVASERATRNTTMLRARFEMKHLADGQYTVKITDGKAETAQKISVKTESPTQEIKRTISVL